MHSHVFLCSGDLHTWLASYPLAHLDIGCGDGSAALAYARERPDTSVVGLDICLDNLHRKIRNAPDNLRFVRCDATAPPATLHGRFDSGTIAFPFGSLLRDLMGEDPGAIEGILSPFRPRAPIQLWINETAIRATIGFLPDTTLALRPLRGALENARITPLSNREIRQQPSRWAHRIGHCKASRTWLISGRYRPATSKQAMVPPEHVQAAQ